MICHSKIQPLLCVLLLIFSTLGACKKVSTTKLEGEWELTEGVEKISYTANSGNTFDQIITYTGASHSVTETINGVVQLPAKEALPYTLVIKFEKKSGAYEKIVSHSKTINNTAVYTFKRSDAGAYDFKNLDQKVEQIFSEVEKGIYTITGGAGDVKKNSQIVLRPSSSNQTLTENFSYFDGAIAVSPSGRYMYSAQNSNNIIDLPLTQTSTQSASGTTSKGIVFDVKELSKGLMKLSAKDEENKTIGISSTKFTREINYTFRER
jgi:hypothetical protein